MDHIEETFKLTVKEVSADRGYGQGTHLHELEQRNIRSFVPNFQREVGESIDPEIFQFDRDRDVYICKNGNYLKE